MIPNKYETSLELWTQRNKIGNNSMLAIAMSDWWLFLPPIAMADWSWFSLFHRFIINPVYIYTLE